MNLIKYIILSPLIFLISSCDLEKFTGYDHEADPIPDSAKMYGTIDSNHDQKPIKDAMILIGDQATFSDDNGEYLFYYYLGEDDDRNKPVNIRISAARHLPLDTSIVIFPENQLSKTLTYASPLILRIALVDTICQAEIFDYQGADDIIQVTGTFFYKRSNERQPSLTTKVGLTRVAVDMPNTAYYQTTLIDSIVGIGRLMTSSFRIHARDRLAYSDSLSNIVAGVDTLLFPPIF